MAVSMAESSAGAFRDGGRWGGVVQDQEEEWMAKGLCWILIPLSGLKALHGATWFCASDWAKMKN